MIAEIRDYVTGFCLGTENAVTFEGNDSLENMRKNTETIMCRLKRKITNEFCQNYFARYACPAETSMTDPAIYAISSLFKDPSSYSNLSVTDVLVSLS